MRRKFTSLCLALVGALMASPAFAQGENVTFKLKNADMEQGLKGWAVDGVDVMGTNTKNPASQVGFHGMNQGVQETWHSNYTNPLGDSYVMQRVKGLPNGTYVFGAYIGAASQVRDQEVCNRDTIHGVSLFANEAAVPVATSNPDLANEYRWAHSSKFNVATQVVDGTLEVGLKIEDANVNYVVWDNATLYFFGNMSEEAALDAMAEIDMERAVAVADTLVAVKMNVDSLANLQVAIATAKAATTTAATLWNDNEELFRYMGFARVSEGYYKKLKQSIEAAKVILGGTWTQGSTPALLPALEAAIASAEQAYAEATLDRSGLTALRKELSWVAGDVKVDSVYAAKADLYSFMLEIMRVLNRPGGYSSTQLESLSNLESELTDTLTSYKYEMDAQLPLEERTVNPNSLIPYIARVYNAIEIVRNNPISMDYTEMPIEFKAGEDGWIEGTEVYNQSSKTVAYTSPLYLFNGKVENFRITVNKAKSGSAYFCLSGLEFYDRYGTKIELSEDYVETNADHNSLNSTPDGGGIPALFDDDPTTFFHSAWMNMPAEAHYLEITLPDGGYDAFSFKMISRDNSSGYSQDHTFPGEMIISTPMPERDTLIYTLELAKELNAYSSPIREVGFYKNDFSYLTDAVAKVEEALEGYPSESECESMNEELTGFIRQFAADDHSIYLLEPEKEYRIISAMPEFYEKQGVHKAITAHAGDSLWWENACADSLRQVFVFEPILDENGEHVYEYFTPIRTLYNGESIGIEHKSYFYSMKNVATGLYVDYSGNDSFSLVEQPCSLRLVPLGGGQFNLEVEGFYGLWASLHSYGDGLSAIVEWATSGANGAGAWYIRELAEIPWTVTAGNETDYRSEYIHLYEPTSSIFLTAANKNCAFEGLAIYDLYGNVVPAAVEVKGREATVVLETEVTSFSFALNNKEKVKLFTINTLETHVLSKLQAAYDAAVAVAPVKGTGVGMYIDLSEYEVALAYAEPLLAGDASDEKMQGAIEMLNEAVANLVPNMPDPNRLYYIVSALEAFKENHGVEMMMYAGDEKPMWTFANTVNENRYWQFVPAESGEGYYLKNVGTGMYLGYETGNSTPLTMVEDMALTVPYTITSLHHDTVAIATADNGWYRIHANGHMSGRGKGSNIVYWNSGLGTSSAWRLCEVEAYERDYAMYMFRANAEIDGTANVAIELENPAAVAVVDFSLCLPEGVTIESLVVNNERVVSEYELLEMHADNMHYITLAMTEGALEGYSGAVFNVTLKVAADMAPGEYPINISNIVVTTMNGTEEAIADFASSIVVTRVGESTGIDEVENAARIYGADGAVVAMSNADATLYVYTMAGQLVKQWSLKPGKNTMALPAGVYLIDGAKVVVR